MPYSQANENGFSNKFISKLNYEYENSNKYLLLLVKQSPLLNFAVLDILHFLYRSGMN